MYFAEICVNSNVKTLDKLFTYILPDQFAHVQVGHRVIVPFGNRRAEGFILNKHMQQERLTHDVALLKSVVDVVDAQPWFTEEMLLIAEQISRYYLCTLSEALQLFVVGTGGISNEYIYTLTGEQGKNILSGLEENILVFLQKKDFATYQELRKICGEQGLHRAINKLVEKGVVARTQKTNKRFKEKTQSYIKLQVEAEKIVLPKRAIKQQQLLEILKERGEILLADALLVGVSRATVKNMQKAGLIEIQERRIYRNSYTKAPSVAARHLLTEQQANALETFEDNLQANTPRAMLVHGITGSGKTEIYLRMCQEVLNRGKQVLILVPEIALTGQLVRLFQEFFQTKVAVSHSRLSQNERVDVYTQIRNESVNILIGARSAVFAPFNNLGLIIADEEHENSYRQDVYPYYDALKVAQMRCKYLRIPLVMGSATPSLENYYQAQQGEMDYVYLDKRANSSAVLPEVHIVDMRAELAAKNFNVLSRGLQEAIRETLTAGKQAIILLNRRGFSTFIMCRDCGHVVKCDNCDVSMVYHKNNVNSLYCHYCGHTESPPDICPKCSSHKIKFFGSGTQKLEESLQRDFAEYKVLRMDQDTTRGKFGHEEILQEFAKGEPCILVGTQMVAKGHDFPNVTLVGILAADAGLNIPDYRAAEGAFALLTQMSGRAGRADSKGRVFVQTYNPEHNVIKFVQTHDYKGFAEQELQMRELFGYPPYGSILKIKITGTHQGKMEESAQMLATELQTAMQMREIEVQGPFYSVIKRVNGVYRMYIICKGQHLSYLQEYCYNNKIYLRKDISLQVDPSRSI